MLEEVGQNIGNSLGRLIEIDRRACQSDQAKFMRIRVDLPIDKPLRRGGNVVSRDGEKYWIHFRYERLPTFCYFCGMLGHDDKHFQAFVDGQNSPKQYGEWLKANGTFKGGNTKQRNFSSSSHNAGNGERASGKNQATESMFQSTPVHHKGGSAGNGSFQNLKNTENTNMSAQV